MQSQSHQAVLSPRSFQLLQHLVRISAIASSVQHAQVLTSVDNNYITTGDFQLNTHSQNLLPTTELNVINLIFQKVFYSMQKAHILSEIMSYCRPIYMTHMPEMSQVLVH